MRKILNIILVIVLLILLVFVSYSRYIKKDKVINFFGYKFLIVLTGSMEPEIPGGSLIVIKEYTNYEIRRYCYL